MSIEQIVDSTKELSIDELAELQLALQREALIRGSAEVARGWAGKKFHMDLRTYIPDPPEPTEDQITLE
jgi:ribosomal protein L7/L12